jgi:hypothetical protein
MNTRSRSSRLRKANILNQVYKEIMYEREDMKGEYCPSGRVKSLSQILGINDEQCVYCNQSIMGAATTDEIIPCSEGGRMNHMNCVPCCGSCNSSKGNQCIKKFVNNGGNVNKDRPIPTPNRKKILTFVKRNEKYMEIQEDDRAMGSLKEGEEMVVRFLDDINSLLFKLNRSHLPSYIQNDDLFVVSPR